ncbi:MAG: hypothetical protein EAZ60_26390 [Oscillatoriales cyanobacterium]|nr:MAG: hypothetical protein EAZ83_09555 [Oscillatoriales cyanobacterium]TAE94745.1 MAG: hypothetical protein EAZ79_21840 [Oscillatoriales cyanobacterium]TAF20728.1 MAG: hypothetical protein EAZ73_11350 [Oscillatoriales cyanobacterium]TAF36855.1 MAG: hypothetical protein EAZ69_09095 [Oscillatoriales cyanobacterium]TAF51316.1 MAG: hypothetical protein EAZ60_26390 [Oscillatoriales cyanobacterium]
MIEIKAIENRVYTGKTRRPGLKRFLFRGGGHCLYRKPGDWKSRLHRQNPDGARVEDILSPRTIRTSFV